MLISSIEARLARLTSRFIHKVGAWLDVSRQRRKLARLDDRMLKDIGISRASALNEAHKPFWNLPEHSKPPLPTNDAKRRCCEPDCCTEPSTA